MPTIQKSDGIADELQHPHGKITIARTPMTRFGVLYFPKFEPKENDKSLGWYKVNAFSTIDEAKKYGIKIADAYIKTKNKNKSMDR